MSDYTINDLRKAIAGINAALLEEGSRTLLEISDRVGRHAVDEYTIDAAGGIIGVSRNICYGTARESSDAAWRYYNTKSNELSRAKLNQKTKLADAVISFIRTGCRDVDRIYRLVEATGLLDSRDDSG